MSKRKKRNDFDRKTLREKKIDFRRHLRTYLVMSGFFIAINVFTVGSIGWAVWPILGWGIGVVMQGLSLYGPLADPEDTHPRETDNRTPLPDLDEEMELRELETRRTYRDEDLV